MIIPSQEKYASPQKEFRNPSPYARPTAAQRQAHALEQEVRTKPKLIDKILGNNEKFSIKSQHPKSLWEVAIGRFNTNADWLQVLVGLQECLKNEFFEETAEVGTNLRRQVRSKFSNLLKNGDDQGRENWTQRVYKEIGEAQRHPLLSYLRIDLDGDDFAIREGAKMLATEFLYRGPNLVTFCDAKLLLQKEIPGQTPASQFARITDEIFWRARIRKTLRPLREEVSRHLVPKNIRYCTDDGKDERLQVDANRLKFSEKHIITNGDGVECPIPAPDVAAARLYAEIMTRSKGIQDLADLDGAREEFLVTITLPSEYHPTTTNKSGGRYENPNYDPRLTVRDGHKFLVKNWNKFRARMKRRKIPLFFVRSSQPHLDGTEHWHISMFLRNADVDVVRRAIYKLFSVNEEEIEGDRQIDFQKKDEGESLAYISRHLRYVTRHLKPEETDPAESPEARKKRKEQEDEALRAQQWACANSIRRVAFSHTGVTVYRILRKQKDLAQHQPLKEAAAAAGDGRFADFYRAKVEGRIFPFYSSTTNRFGDIGKKCSGLKIQAENEFDGDIIFPFTSAWKIIPKPKTMEEIEDFDGWRTEFETVTISVQGPSGGSPTRQRSKPGANSSTWDQPDWLEDPQDPWWQNEEWRLAG